MVNNLCNVYICEGRTLVFVRKKNHIRWGRNLPVVRRNPFRNLPFLKDSILNVKQESEK